MTSRAVYARSIVAVFALVALSACGGGGSILGPTTEATDATDDTTESDETDVTNPDGTTKPTKPTVPRTTTERTTVPNPSEPTTTVAQDALDDLQVGQTGFTAVLDDDQYRVTAAAELVNHSDSFISHIDWTARLLAADGTVLEESTSSNETVGPGATTWLVPHFFLDAGSAEPTTFEVTLVAAQPVTSIQVAGGDETMELAGVSLALVGVKPYVDVNETLHFEGAFKNDSDARLTDVNYVCGGYLAGQLVAGAFGFMPEMLPGQDTGFDTTSALADIDPVPDSVMCAATPVIISTYEPGVITSGLVVEAGLSYNPGGLDPREHDTIVGITATNSSTEAAFDVAIQVDLLDESGVLAHLASTTIPYILPGQTFYTGAWPVVAKDSPPPASTRVRVKVDHWGDPTNAMIAGLGPLDLTAFHFDVDGAQYVVSYSDGDVVGTATNRSAEDVSRANIACTVLRNGRPVAGNSWIIDPLPVGTPVPFDVIFGYNADIVHDDVQCQVFLTSISEIGPLA